jgi:thioredoxin 1
MSKEVTLTDDNFQTEVLDYKGVVLVDFWAEWCMPCRIVAPIVEEIAEEMGDKVKIGKLNVDENPQISMKYQVTGIPTLLILKDVEVVDRYVGVTPKGTLVEALKTALGE